MPKHGRVGIREVDGLTIIFWDARTIYVKTEYGTWNVIHRWFHVQRGFCTNYFRPFQKKLRHNKHLSWSYIAENAVKYDLTISWARQPDLSKVEIEMLPAKGRNKNKEVE